MISLGLSVGGFVWPATSGASNPAPVRAGEALTNTALGGFSQLDQIDMLSSHLGYALASTPDGNSRYTYYLVRTTDQARTWTVRSLIAANVERFPIFTDFGTFGSDPSIDFVSRTVGYVTGPGGMIDVTDDGGVTWRAVTPRSAASSYGVIGRTASIVTTSCTRTAATVPRCTSVLREYPAGSLNPERSSVIPDARNPHPADVALLAVAPDSTQVVNLDSDEISTASSLVATYDDGKTWQRLSNPCAGSLIEQLLVAGDGQWILSCFHDEGMYHGPAKIFRSTNDGTSWMNVLNDTVLRDIRGNLGGTPAYLFESGNDQVLYAAMMNPAGGMEASTDGGTKWTPVRELGNTGGSPVSVSTFGPTAAVSQVFEGPVYVTSDNRTWRLVPPLPAGTYLGDEPCTPQDVTLSLRHHVYGGLTYTDVDFTSRAKVACYLSGSPIIQPLDAGGAALGPSSTSEPGQDSGDFVVLARGGAVASFPLLINTPSNATRPTCDVGEASALRIEFGTPSVFTLSMGTRALATCRVYSSLLPGSVRPGVGKP